MVGCVALFAIVTLPWLYRQAEAFGSLFPAASSGRLMWLIDYQQLFSLTNPPTLDGWLAQGLAAIAASRLAIARTTLAKRRLARGEDVDLEAEVGDLDALVADAIAAAADV